MQGHLYRVGRHWYVDTAMLKALAGRVVVEPMLNGYQVLLPGALVRCTPVDNTPLPNQAGTLFRCDGNGPRLAALARVAGEWEEWPHAVAASVVACGCHPAVTASATPPPCACKMKPIEPTTAVGSILVGGERIYLAQLPTRDGDLPAFVDPSVSQRLLCEDCSEPLKSTLSYHDGVFQCHECETTYPVERDSPDPVVDTSLAERRRRLQPPPTIETAGFAVIRALFTDFEERLDGADAAAFVAQTLEDIAVRLTQGPARLLNDLRFIVHTNLEIPEEDDQ